MSDTSASVYDYPSRTQSPYENDEATIVDLLENASHSPEPMFPLLEYPTRTPTPVLTTRVMIEARRCDELGSSLPISHAISKQYEDPPTTSEWQG